MSNQYVTDELPTVNASCASAGNGHVTLAPISAINSRRLTWTPPLLSQWCGYTYRW